MGILSPSRTRVAVLRGGPSSEYDVSLKTGEHVLSILREQPDKYDPVDVFISRDGDWHVGGIVRQPELALRNADVAWNAMHGAYGEDGQVQKILEKLMIPYTGSNSVSSALAINKDMAKKAYESIGLLTPRHEVIREDNLSEEQIIYIFRNYLHPVIVKPANAGSSIGVRLAHTFKELVEAIEAAFEHSSRVLVEEFVRGKEATCGVIEDMRGERFYALLPVEIRKSAHLFDYDAKYSGKTEELCPGSFTTKENKMIEDAAKRAHESLGLSHYSRSDFIVTQKGKIYILETNSLPGFTQESLLPKSLGAVGIKTHEFVDHVINITINSR